jgi:hypothetical protein
MKLTALASALVLAAALAARADNTIKATTRLLPDGTTLTMITNPETHTREETIAQTNGKVLRKTVFALNEQNFATGATHYDGKENVRYKEVYSFDAEGRITESKLFASDGRPLGRRVFIYDTGTKGQARVEDYDANGRLIPPTARAVPKPSGGRPTVRRATPVK